MINSQKLDLNTKNVVNPVKPGVLYGVNSICRKVQIEFFYWVEKNSSQQVEDSVLESRTCSGYLKRED